MSVPFKFLCLILTLLLQTRLNGAEDEPNPISCYYCNTRDNPDCDHIEYGDNNTLVKNCKAGICSITKGQWGYPGDRKAMLWRGCGEIKLCTQASGLCCHCGKSFCNFNNDCFNRGHLLVPGIIVFTTQIFIIVINLFSTKNIL